MEITETLKRTILDRYYHGENANTLSKLFNVEYSNAWEPPV